MTMEQGASPDSPACDECGSPFNENASRMAGLCPECAHHLYGYPNCEHRFENGHCVLCGWDKSRSPYIETLINGD